MGSKSKIEWTDATWNPWQGCRKVSAGCANCYMYRDKKRYGQDPSKVVRSSSRTFNLPKRLPADTRVFVCSWSDFFIEEADAWRDDAWGIIWQHPELRFIIPTKRTERIASCLPSYWGPGWPHVCLLASVENQESANKRIPELLAVPAACRGISAEPLLGPINFRWTNWCECASGETYREYLERGGSVNEYEALRALDWVIAGGESGPGARPMHPDWVRGLRDQCGGAGVPFFFKQWGEWLPWGQFGDRDLDEFLRMTRAERRPQEPDVNGAAATYRVGKKRAGRFLDGHEHSQFPEVLQHA